MPSSVALGAPLYQDGMSWSSLLSRQLAGGVAVWDTNTSTAAVNPLGGVFHGPAKPLAVAPLATPGMSVLVNAGYCAVPHPTAQHGIYLFGLRAQGTLTVAANGTGSSRTDIVIVRVYDLSSSSSYADVEIVTGTPGSGQPATPGVSLLLGTVTVAPSAASITTANITDTRTFTVAPGGVLPVTTATAPPLAPGQVVWNSTTGTLETLAPPVNYSETFTATTSWVSPFTGLVYAQPTGGSGGGGGGFQDSQGYGHTESGAGGGGGEWAGGWVAVTIGHSYPVNVGTGGIRGDGGNNFTTSPSTPTAGAAGTLSSFTGDTATITANPGLGGQPGGSYFPDPGGLGGSGSTAPQHNPGGAGGAGSNASSAGGGGGGGSGSPGAPGGAGGAGHGSSAGAGGTAGPGGSPGGWGGGGGNTGTPGTVPGGGGGGGYADNQTWWSAGGNGAGGQVILSWSLQPAALTPVTTTIAGEGTTPSEYLNLVSTGTSTGLTAGTGSSYGWGIGYGGSGSSYGWVYTGNAPGGYNGYTWEQEPSATDGQVATQIGVQFGADGHTDYAIDARWGIAVPEAAVDSTSPNIPNGQCRIIVYLDGRVLDQVFLSCSASGGRTWPGDSGSFTVYTSSQFGTTPGAGQHTITLAVETLNTLSGNYSGAHVGDLASVGSSASPFGGALRGPYLAALVAEQSYLRVAGISASGG